MSTHAPLTTAALVALLLGFELYGQVPTIITYQGHVQASGAGHEHSGNVRRQQLLGVVHGRD